MKILHVIPNMQSGGAEKMLVDIVEEMQLKKHHCEVAILTKTNNFFGEQLEKLNIPIYYGENSKVYTLKNIYFLMKIIKKNDYDVIHTHLFGPQIFTPIALKLAFKKIPLITTEHSTHNRRRENRFFFY